MAKASGGTRAKKPSNKSSDYISENQYQSLVDSINKNEIPNNDLWEQLSKEGSMLWVVTHDGPQCVPFYALPRDTNTIAITFSPENMQYKSRCVALAETLRYFKGLHFNFGTAISQNKSPEPFNNPKKELEQSLKNTMLDMYDLPAQNAPTSLTTDSQEKLL